jgi:protein SCO1/2
MIRRRQWPAAWLAAAAGLLLTAALAGCANSDAHYALKNISGLVSPLDFQLTDQDGQAVTAANYHHDLVVLYFGYTECPDECPTTLTMLANALRALGPQASKVRILFVTVDPHRDSLEVLKRYVNNFGPQFIGLRPDQDELTALSKRYRIAYHYEKADKDGNYGVDHSNAVFIFDRSGRARLLALPDSTSQQVASDLHRLLASS